MKPSEKVITTIKTLINDDWVNGGGNRYSQEAWHEMINNDPQKKLEYTLTAICIVMDEMAEKTRMAGMGFGDIF